MVLSVPVSYAEAVKVEKDAVIAARFKSQSLSLKKGNPLALTGRNRSIACWIYQIGERNEVTDNYCVLYG